MHQIIEEMVSIATQLQDDEQLTRLKDLKNWMDQPATHIVVCGEFKRGKSTLINSLLGADLCPVDVLPATAVPTVIKYATTPEAIVHFFDGHTLPIPATKNGLTRLSVGSDISLETVRLIDVGFPCDLLKQGIVIIDTPGVNDLSQQRADVTYGFLPLADAAIVVLDSTAPITKSENQFLQEQVLPNVLEHLIFVLGKIDRLDDDEIEDALDGARNRLFKIIGHEVVVYPISSLRSLKGEAHLLSPLIDTIQNIHNKSTENRTNLFQQRLGRIAHELIEQVETRLKMIHANADEMSESRMQLEVTHQNVLGKFDALQEYVNLYGKSTLIELIDRSLSKAKEDLIQDLLYQIDIRESAIDVFVEKQVPYLTTLFVKKWSEAKASEIHIFLVKFTERIASDFGQFFATPLEIAGLPKSFITPEIEKNQRTVTVSRTQDIIYGHLLPTAVPMIAGYIFLGPLGGLTGSLLGQVAGLKIRESKLEFQKSMASEIVNREVVATVEGFQNALREQIHRWFDTLVTLLRNSINEQSNRAYRQLSQYGHIDDITLNHFKQSLKIIEKQLDKGGDL